MLNDTALRALHYLKDHCTAKIYEIRDDTECQPNGRIACMLAYMDVIDQIDKTIRERGSV